MIRMRQDQTKLNLSDTYWNRAVDDLFSDLDTDKGGLTKLEAEIRLKRFGPNALEIHSATSAFRLFIIQFTNPLVLILLFAVAVSVAVNEWTDAAVILAIVVGSGAISFAQEYSAGNAIAKLRQKLTHFVTVHRSGISKRVPSASIVPGDIVILSAGSLIPADGVVLEEQDCFVNQAVLTGETFPVEKQVAPVPAEASLAERTNCLFMGTSVRSGLATMLVVRTGASTEYGQIADRLSQQAPETEFQRGIRNFGLMLTRIIVVLVLVVFTFNVLTSKPALESLLFAIALAVGISPELLPAIITINLSKGARRMARSGVIVRRLESIENLGSMDVLCTDKTGTLTEGVVRLDAALDTGGNVSNEVFRLAYLNAHLQTGLANPLDEAITSDRSVNVRDCEKVGEIPYDFTRKRLSVVIKDERGSLTIITKGALSNVIDACTRFRDASGEHDLTKAINAQIQEKFEEWSSEGFRILGVSSKRLEGTPPINRNSESEMVFEGFLQFFDPPKNDAKAAIAALKKLGVRLKIITGDNRHVAAHVAHAVGLPAKTIITGSELNHLSDEALRHAVDRTSLFAEVDPNQKERIIRALQKVGHVVGYMGDGINDATALHDADVGISVDGAVDVAREAADFILMQKGLDVLHRGIEEGRITFANSLKYVFTTTSANFGNMLSMAAASLFLPFLPLLATQILLNNFLSDIPAVAIAGDNVDRESVDTPHRWDVGFIRNFMIVFGLVSSVFDFLMFGILILIVHAAEAEFHTAWFIESLLTELVVALIVRTRRPFYRSRPGRWLWISTAAVALLTLSFPYFPFAGVFGFVPLPPMLLGFIIIITFLYVIATEATKKAFYMRFSPS